MSQPLHRIRQIAVLAALGGALLLGSVATATASTSTSAAPAAPNAVARVDTAMRITGLAGSNKLTISQVPGENIFLVTDVAPITAEVGCATTLAPHGLFAVKCRALTTGLPGTPFKAFFVNGGAGDDVVTNLANAAMSADGGPGNDTLNGGPLGDNLQDSNGNDSLFGNGGVDEINTVFEFAGGTKDVLDGGAGLDILQAGPGSDILRGGDGNDRLVGNKGADVLDAGPGTGDVVAYQNRTTRHVITLDGLANDGEAPGLTGPPTEGDNVLASAEIVQGSSGPDTMIGNDSPNTFEGFDGDDVLIGGRGADLLRGGTGHDRLFSNGFIGANESDGAVDTLDGFTGTDHCRVGALDGDITIACEFVDSDI